MCKWKENCAALVIGGGTASEFARALGHEGTQHIRDYVTTNGGTYFGICAGAYFACHTVHFNRGGELEMYKQYGTCEGTISRPYEASTEKGAEILTISFDRGPMYDVNGGPGTVGVYVNGGGIFLEHPQESTLDPPRHVTLAYFRYLEYQPAAIVKCHVGTNGGIAILSSPHLERFASLEDDVMGQECWSRVLKQGKLQMKETVYYLPSESFCFLSSCALVQFG
ncbi:uncharacterized protein TC_0305-like [Littorina saxatilis]|uniref:uncharacterized protein TC_0305-like n=1 Tax=Littorina saxatilis TaxID=31220 RepID=UPI0038B489DD